MRRPAIALVLAFAAGCGSAPTQSDPEVARQTLQRALDAWKRGDPPDALKDASPPVTVADTEWRRGAKLLAYELADKTEPSGFDQRFTVKLTLDADKKPRTVMYDVSTHPKLVVVRAESP